MDLFQSLYEAFIGAWKNLYRNMKSALALKAILKSWQRESYTE